jgi:hypothetical protein
MCDDRQIRFQERCALFGVQDDGQSLEIHFIFMFIYENLQNSLLCKYIYHLYFDQENNRLLLRGI